MKITNLIKNENGQAVFETLLFLPVLFYLAVVMIKVGNSINASINQQKATRGYTFYLLKGNSLGQRVSDLKYLETQASGIENASSFIIAWKINPDLEKFHGSYYKLPTFAGASASDEDCLEDKIEDGVTSCIKVFTMFGVCGESYMLTPSEGYHKSDYPGGPQGYSKSCLFK